MKKILLRGIICLSLALLASLGVAQSFAQPPMDVPANPRGESYPIPGRYIIVFKSHVADPAAEARNFLRGRRGQIHHTYSYAIKGFSATLPEAAYNAIRRNPNVDYVEQDATVYAWEETTQTGATWGIDRIDQAARPLNQQYTYDQTGAGVRAYVIDTGIRSSHIEFSDRLASGFTAIQDGRGTGDCNGHGTHVAGTVGGTLYGVAKGVTLVPVRVLDCNGSGTLSGVIAGVDWVTREKNENESIPMVANMSLGGGASSSLDIAVTTSVAAGVVYAVAAGNSNANACNYSPARAPSALTVGSTTSSDARSSFSNFGTCVDLFAPGSSITSAWYTGNTATNTISGTSMASPHVAGVAALVLGGNPSATTAEVNAAIVNGATPNKVSSPGTGSPNLLLYSRVRAGEPMPAPLSITTSSLPDATADVYYTATLEATGGASPYDWSVTGLPLELALVGNAISGTPSSTGTYEVSVTVTDFAGSSSSRDLALQVSEASLDSALPSITSFSVIRSNSGPWKNAKVVWTVADDAALATVQVRLLNRTSLLDSVHYSVSGLSASGETNLRTRGSPTDVGIIVTDAAGNVAIGTIPY